MARKRRESFEMALARVIALDELPEKECRKCGEVKSPAEFSAKPSGRFGLNSWCKVCDAEDKKARQATYRARNETNDPHADPTHKRCSDCGRTRPRTDYRQNKTKPDGLHPYCRDCAARRDREQRANRKAHNATRDPYADPTLKRCSGCKQMLPRTDYPQNKTMPDGLHPYCRECNARRAREQRENYRTHNATRNPYSDPTLKRCSDCGQMRPRTDYPQNKTRPDGLNPQCRECNARRAREWQLKNPDKRREHLRAKDRRRRARKRQNGTVPYREEDVFAESDYLCVYCGAPAEEIDHFIPIALGGADAPWNVVATCIACNRGPGGKFARDPIEFLISRGIRIDRVIVEHACGEVEEIPLRDACADGR
ncbi:MAG TPA: HNH endonuclease signature motif containing protein [Calditerricola sp.]